MTMRPNSSHGHLSTVILAYDDTQNTAHSITCSPGVRLAEAPITKAKSRRTWNTRRLRLFSEQLLKPFSTISIKTKPRRPSLSNLTNFSMLRSPPPPPPEEYVECEDDYNNFDAWEGDFDIEPDEVSHPNVKMSFKGGVPPPPRNGPGRQPPLPPRNNVNEDAPPGGGAPHIPRQPQPGLPRKNVFPPKPESDDDDYLEPSTGENDEAYLAPQSQSEETYEEADELPRPPSRNPVQFRALPPQLPAAPHWPARAVPQVPPEEEYEEAPGDTETYEDADDLTSQNQIVKDYEMPSDAQEYEDAEELSAQTKAMQISDQTELDADDFDDDSTYEAPEEVTTKKFTPRPVAPVSQRAAPLPPIPAIPTGIKQKTLVTPQVKMVLPSQDTLRQKRSQLRKVIPQVNNKHNNSNDDDAKKSSMLLDFPKTDPQRTSASGTRGSGSGSFIPPRPSADPPPPIPAQSSVTPQCNHKIEDEQWYFDIDRSEVENKLDCMDGMFLVRPSKRGGPRSPYTLCVFHNTRVYNLNIRLCSDEKYALGTPHPNEKTFNSVSEMINYHRQQPIVLAGEEIRTVLLTESPYRDDIYDQTA